MTRVLFVEDHTVLRESLRVALERGGLEVVGEAADGVEAVLAARALRPDVVLMDISLPNQDGIEATRQIRAGQPETQVVILTMFADGSTLQQAIRAGAAGYLVKDCTTAEIIAMVRAVAAGEVAISRGVARSMLGVDGRAREPVLTERETEVLQELAQGATTAQAAARLFISQKTVRNHLASIYEKMDARDRTQAVLQGLRMGIISLHRPSGG